MNNDTPNHNDHLVYFYDKDEILIKALTEYIQHGLQAGDRCLIISTRAHQKSIEEKLVSSGIDLNEVQKKKRILFLNAGETLAKFMVNDMPDPQLFYKTVGELVSQVSVNGAPVRTFGEMVNLLWEQGNQLAAKYLEKLWNDLRESYPFVLFCAYSMDNFDNELHSAESKEIIALHSRGLRNQGIIHGKVIDTGKDGVIVELPDSKQIGVPFNSLLEINP